MAPDGGGVPLGDEVKPVAFRADVVEVLGVIGVDFGDTALDAGVPEPPHCSVVRRELLFGHPRRVCVGNQTRRGSGEVKRGDVVGVADGGEFAAGRDAGKDAGLGCSGHTPSVCGRRRDRARIVEGMQTLALLGIEEQIKTVVVAGDWHGNLLWMQRVLRGAALDGHRVIVHVGDLAVLWPGASKFTTGLKRLLEELDLVFIFADGKP